MIIQEMPGCCGVKVFTGFDNYNGNNSEGWERDLLTSVPQGVRWFILKMASEYSLEENATLVAYTVPAQVLGIELLEVLGFTKTSVHKRSGGKEITAWSIALQTYELPKTIHKETGMLVVDYEKKQRLKAKEAARIRNKNNAINKLNTSVLMEFVSSNRKTRLLCEQNRLAGLHSNGVRPYETNY